VLGGCNAEAATEIANIFTVSLFLMSTICVLTVQMFSVLQQLKVSSLWLFSICKEIN